MLPEKIPMPWLDDTPTVCGGIGSKHTNEEGKEFRRPYLKVTLADIRRMADNPVSVEKEEAPWIIPSSLPSRTFEKQKADGEYWYLWSDIDDPSGSLSVQANLIGHRILCGRDAEFYTSRSATEDRQKYRVIVPLRDPLPPGAWQRCQILLSLMLKKVGITPDPAAHRFGQLCYLPNRGAFYRNFAKRSGSLLSPMTDWSMPLKALALQEHQHRERMLREKETRQAIAQARRATFEAVEGSDIIGRFNRAVSVESLLIEHGYEQKGLSDDWKHPNSESGSYSLRVMDGRVFSLSPADALYSGGAGGHSLDSFEVLTRLSCGGDKRKAFREAKQRIGGVK